MDNTIYSHAWTRAAQTPYNETLDLLHYRCETARQAQEVLLEQSTSNLETPCEAIQVAGLLPRRALEDLWRQSDIQLAASWSESFWDEEDFYYCLSPNTVHSLESISPVDSVASYIFCAGEKLEGDFLSKSSHHDAGKIYSFVFHPPTSLHGYSHIVRTNIYSYLLSLLLFFSKKHSPLNHRHFSVCLPSTIQVVSIRTDHIPTHYFCPMCIQLKIHAFWLDYSILSLRPSYSSLRSCPSAESTESAILSTCHLTMSPSQAISGPSRTSRIIDPEDPEEGEDLDLPESQRPGLHPFDFGFLRPGYIQPDSPVPVTRAEPITVTVGVWKRQVTVVKPNADYRDVPSPIMLPGSPPQRSSKPSLGEFYKVPSRRDPLPPNTRETGGLGISEYSTKTSDKHQSLPPSPALKVPERAVNFMNHPSNSDVSILNLGSPTQPLTSTSVVSSSLPSDKQEQPQHHSPQSASLSSSPRCSKGHITSAPGPSVIQSSHNPGPSQLLSRRRLGQHNEIRPPVILSVEVPDGNELSWSSPESPQSKGTSPDGIFALDEELNVRIEIHRFWNKIST